MMAHQKGEAKPLIPQKWIIKSLIFLVIVMLIVIVSRSNFSCSSSSWRDWVGGPRHSRMMQPIKPRVVQWIVPLDKEKWSDWQNLPPGKFFRISNAGWLEIQFVNGETKRYYNHEATHIGKVKESIFRLRGEGGKATLYIEDSD